MRVSALAAVLAAMAFSGCLSPRDPNGREDTTCTACHGDSSRAGEALQRAAPPKDLYGNTDPRYPGVGAHERHLQGTELYEPVACERCHPVPESLGSDGHNDGHTQVVALTLDGGFAYDVATRTCKNSTCHLSASGVWTRPRPSEETCGTCHGVPPPAPHPQAGACASCHGELSKATHLDGQVTRVTERCDACHGSDMTGGPPKGLDGGTANTQRGVGAHQAHVSGGQISKPVACETCHEVPATVATATHPNGVLDVRAAVGFDAVAGTCRNACHKEQSATWAQPGPLSCTGCHGQPPAYPHPQMNNCGQCHPAITVAQRTHHVDGTVDVNLPQQCDGCHGSASNPAPPRDLDGGTATSRPGVGAHQSHVVGRGLARKVACAECHVVPQQVRDPGHLDGVVQVRFSGVAINGALTPSYTAGTCASVACHDVSAYTNGGPTGATKPAPSWVGVDAGQATCTSCHGQPPPAPHAARSDCGTCHYLDAERHINGHLDLVP